MIKLIAVKERDETRRMAYFTVDDKYDFSDGGIPIDLDTNKKVMAWLKKNEDSYLFLILQKTYRDGEVWADWKRFKTKDNTDLQAFQEWIAKGHKNKTIDGYQVIEKQRFEYRHPKEVKPEILWNKLKLARSFIFPPK